jgi:glucose-1-phosphate thymidylyltransferase
LSDRQAQQVGCPEEIAFENGWIDREALLQRAELFHKTNYGKYLKRLAG